MPLFRPLYLALRTALIKAVTRLACLQEIYARRVGLTGHLPAELGLLRQLRVLSMGNNMVRPSSYLGPYLSLSRPLSAARALHGQQHGAQTRAIIVGSYLGLSSPLYWHPSRSPPGPCLTCPTMLTYSFPVPVPVVCSSAGRCLGSWVA